MRDIFSDYYHNNFWKDPDSVSGAGSNLAATEAIRRDLPVLFKNLQIKSILDISCGDHFWGQFMLWPEKYIGADIVPAIIEDNERRFPGFDWRVLDAATDKLPQVDMVLCRDTLVHFPNRDIEKTLKNFRASASTWLLATTFPGENANHDIEVGQWRPTNLEALRYGLGPAKLLLNEGAVGKFGHKSLGLWRLNP